LHNNYQTYDNKEKQQTEKVKVKTYIKVAIIKNALDLEKIVRNYI